jgi:hypothetical protein
MNTAFIIGNGESRTIFPVEQLKGHGTIYGCNAIYRDYPDLCDHIVAVNDPMYEELKEWHDGQRALGLFKSDKETPNTKIYSRHDISKWNYVIPHDKPSDLPDGLKLYRNWIGSDNKGKVKIIDLSTKRGSGMSATLLAAEAKFTEVVILGFDMMGSEQWKDVDSQSRKQNNIYKDTHNYPSRMNMKAYLKYEWMFQLRQIIRKHPKVNFYFINRVEYLNGNPFLNYYFDQPNIKAGIYADLKSWVDGNFQGIRWRG